MIFFDVVLTARYKNGRKYDVFLTASHKSITTIFLKPFSIADDVIFIPFFKLDDVILWKNAIKNQFTPLQPNFPNFLN